MAKSECLTEALKQLSHFDVDELEEYASQIFYKASKYDMLKGRAALDRAIEEINNERLQSYFEEATIKANNTWKFDRVAKMLREGKGNLKSLVIRRNKSLTDNIESYKRTYREKLTKVFFDGLSKEDLTYLMNPSNSDDIARALDGKPSTDLAKKIAKQHEQYILARNADMVKSNAMLLEHINKDRQFAAVHNRSKILGAGRNLGQAAKDAARGIKYSIKESKTLWKKAILKCIDIEGTFSNTKAVNQDGSIDMKKVDGILDNVFRNIVEDRSNIFTKSTTANDRNAVQRKSRMFFKWKDNESFMQYNKIYGHDNYFNALMADINRSGNKIGVSYLWGDSPGKTFEDLKRIQFEVDPKSNLWVKNAELYFKTAMGENNTAVSPTAASIASAIKNLTSMGSLGGIGIMSLPDIANGIAFANRWGFSYWKSYLEHMTGLFNLIPKDDRKHIAKIFKANVDSHIGYAGKFVDAQTFSDSMNKATTAFYKYTGSEALDKGNKLSGLSMMAKSLYEMRNKSWNELSEHTRYQMDKYNLTSDEWDVLRKKNSYGLFTTDNVQSLTDDEVRSLHEKSDQSIPLSHYRDNLYAKVYSMFDVASENSFLAPNDFTRAWTTWGHKPGTPGGILLGFLMQFKGYAISFADRVIYQGFQDAVGANAKFSYGLKLMAATLPMSVLSTYLGYLIQGKSMPSFEQMSPGEKVYTSMNVLLPSLSMLTRIFSPNNQGSDMIMDAFNGVSLRFLSNALSAPIQLMEDDPDKAKKSFKKAAESILPFRTFPILGAYMHQIFGDKPYLEPGQTQKFGA